MIMPLQHASIPAFIKACSIEHVFGSKILTALRCYGISSEKAQFFLISENEIPLAALYLLNDILVISASHKANVSEIADLIRQKNIHEVDTNLTQCIALQALLGGKTESSFYMKYEGDTISETFPNMHPGNLNHVFHVLQQSHEYYRTHLCFEEWSADLSQKLDRGLAELYQLEYNGLTIGTGSIISEDDECGVIAAVAVIPEYRHKNFGTYISKFLVQRIQAKNKTPRLISGYDAVSDLYAQIGFVRQSRWGELYL